MSGKKKSSPFSFFSFLKLRRSKKVYEESWEDSAIARRSWPSDYDKDYWVADPRINTKASAFIDRFRTRVFESERRLSMQSSEDP